MSKQAVTWLIIMIGAACAMGGCAVARDVVGGTDVAPVGDEIPVVTFDDELVQVAQRLPGFGGMFFDDAGMLNIYLVETNPPDGQTVEEQHNRIKLALIAVFGQDNLNQHLQVGAGAIGQENPVTPAGIQILQGAYDMIQLAAWRPAVNRTLSLSGVVMTDMDESKNRLRIGIDRPEHRHKVEEALKNEGVPLDAVIIEHTDRTYLMQRREQSQEVTRPITGGLRIESEDSQFCTLGFSATVEEDDSRGFITASHCTGIRAKKSATRFFQDGIKGRNRYIGSEQNKPHYFTASSQPNHRCQPAARRCRYSDSVFVQYAQNAPVAYGRIARPTNTSGSIAIDTANPVFWITDTGSIAIVGQRLHKVGSSTGWTFGRVSQTCIDVPAFYLNDSDAHMTLLCQKRIAATTDPKLLVGPGDSGAPVFAWRNQQVSQVDLFGIAWGGNADGSQLTFSPLRSIEAELGELSLQATPDLSPPLPGVSRQ